MTDSVGPLVCETGSAVVAAAANTESPACATCAASTSTVSCDAGCVEGASKGVTTSLDIGAGGMYDIVGLMGACPGDAGECGAAAVAADGAAGAGGAGGDTVGAAA